MSTMKLIEIGKNKLSGRDSAKEFVTKWFEENKTNDLAEIEVDFDLIENVNQSFMNELLRTLFEFAPSSVIYQKNCLSSHVTMRFDIELKRIQGIREASN